MKIFYKKDFQRVLGEFKKYKEDTANVISALEDKAFNLLEDNSKLKDKNLKWKVELGIDKHSTFCYTLLK